MAMQYKPTKQKKEKPAKAPKAPKAPKMPKPEKAMAVKLGKAEQVTHSAQNGPNKNLKTKIIAAAVATAVIITAAIVIAVVLSILKARGQLIKTVVIESKPEKIVYTVGEEADYSGLRVLVTRNNGESFVVRYDQCAITGFDSSKANMGQAITVTYEGFNATFFVEIKEPPKPEPLLQAIVLEKLPKTEYVVGDGLDTTGGVILREYSDGTIKRVNLTNQDVFGWKKVTGPGEYELTVKYKENGVIVSTTYQITVTE